MEITNKDNSESEGIDNPAVELENVTRQPVFRPDLVISVQPRTEGSTRAELPVTTTNWTTRTGSQFIPVHGLDFLIGVSSLLIKQTVELDDLSSRVDSENRYLVKVPEGETLYIAREVSDPTQRCLCGSGRAFTMHFHDSTRQEALLLNRRLATASCCFPCRLQEMTVTCPPGDYVGRIKQLWTFMIPFYSVRDANDQEVFVIEGPASMRRSALTQIQFKIMTNDRLRELGRIEHGWNREQATFVTTISWLEAVSLPKHKALLLGAAFLMEYTYFEMAKTSCTRCSCCY